MNRRLLLPLFLLLTSGMAYSQGGNTLIIRFTGAPSGPCSPFMLGINNATGAQYDCLSGAWNLVGGGGAGGTVTSVSFTGGLISVATPTTTPAFTVAGTSGGIPFFDSATTWNTSALLTSNSPVLGGGAGATPKTATFLTTNGTTELDIGVIAGGNGALGLKGNTSGTATCTAPAVAGTSTNPVTCTNAIEVPVGAVNAPSIKFAGVTSGIYQNPNAGVTITVSSADTAAFRGSANGMFLASTGGYGWSSSSVNAASLDTGVSRGGVGMVSVDGGTIGDGLGTIRPGKYATTANCSSGASPAVCAAAASGSVALPTGTNPTLVVNTTAVTANSQILLTVDESLGTKLSVTCNTTLSTLLNPVVTARTAGTSFTFTIGAIIASNPACVSYSIIN